MCLNKPMPLFQRILRRTLLCAVAAAAHGTVMPAGASAPVEPREPDAPIPLPADASVVQGTLSNGLRFAIAPSPVAANGGAATDTVVFLLHLNAGTAHEDDDQIGAATLAANLASHGTLSAHPEAFRRTLDSLGAGRSLRSLATYDSTRFMLSVPLQSGERLSSADISRITDLLGSVLSARSVTVGDEDMDRARRDIVASQLAWAGPSQRITARVLPDMMGDSILAKRMPIYSDADLERTGAQALNEFVDSWYAPGSAIVVVSGAIDAQVVRRALERSLGPLRAEPTPDPPDPGLGEARRAVVRVETDPAIVGDVVQFLVIDEPGAPTENDLAVRARTAERLALEALSQRLRTLALREDSATLQAGVFTNPDAGSFRISTLSVSGSSGSWEKLTREAAATLRSAIELGFSSEELDSARRAVLESLDSEAASEARASPEYRASKIASQLARSNTVWSGEHSRRIARASVPGIDADEVRNNLRRLFDERVRSTLVVTAQHAPPAEAVSRQLAIASGIDAGAVAEVTIPKRPKVTLADADVPQARIVTLAHDPDADLTSATLDSGARLYHRQMDAGSDRIEIALSLLGGSFEEDQTTRGLTEAIESLEDQPATRSQAGSSVASALRSTGIDLDVRVTPDAVTLRASASSADFESAMRLIGMLAREPVIEDSAFERWRASAMARAAAARTEPARAALDDFERVVLERMMGVHAFPTEDELNAMAAQSVNLWLSRIVRESPMTLAIVGDIDRARALQSAAENLGGIEARPTPNAERLRSIPAQFEQPQTIELSRRAELATDAAAVVIGFRSADAQRIDDTLALDLAAAILTQRLGERIGSNAEISGSTVVLNIDGQHPPGSGRFWVRALVHPRDADLAQSILQSELQRLIDTPPAEQELQRAVSMLKPRLDRRLESSGAWADALARSEGLGGVPLASLRASSAVLEGIAAPVVSQTLGRYALPERSFRIRVEPAR